MSVQAIKSIRERHAVKKKPYEILKSLRMRAGLSGAEVGRALGYSSNNGYNQYEYENRVDKLIPTPLLTKLIPILRGRGNPPVTADELIAISEARSLPSDTPSLAGLSSSPPDTLDEANVMFRAPSGSALLPVLYRAEAGVFMEATRAGTKRYGDGPIGPTPDVDTNGQFCVAVVGSDRRETLHCVKPDQVGKASRVGRRCVCTLERDKTGLVEIIVSRIAPSGEPENGDLVGIVIGSYARE